MRLRACLGLILPGLAACTTLPAFVRLQVDDNTIEIKRKPEPPAENGQVPDADER